MQQFAIKLILAMVAMVVMVVGFQPPPVTATATKSKHAVLQTADAYATSAFNFRAFSYQDDRPCKVAIHAPRTTDSPTATKSVSPVIAELAVVDWRRPSLKNRIDKVAKNYRQTPRLGLMAYLQ